MRTGKYMLATAAFLAALVLIGLMAWYFIWGPGEKQYEKEGVLVEAEHPGFYGPERLVYIRKCQGV